MARKGVATTKKVDKYIYIYDDISPSTSPVRTRKTGKRARPSTDQTASDKRAKRSCSLVAHSDEDLRGNLKRSNLIQPCQGLKKSPSDELQQSIILADSLFPSENEKHSLPRYDSAGSDISGEFPRRLQRSKPPLEDNPRRPDPLHDQSDSPQQQAAEPTRTHDTTSRSNRLESDVSESSHQTHLPSDPPVYKSTTKMTAMIPGGAFVPPNQQRNLRACMVCSVVRTYTQFMSGGCPNCEDILELTGNSENVNDCTSQVFEGLITVADTSKSWVARYQRLEGYVAGVYATQVEGILPEEMISAIEAAGINYVPRDGSEDQMIPKD